jgi:hypothetical protein
MVIWILDVCIYMLCNSGFLTIHVLPFTYEPCFIGPVLLLIFKDWFLPLINLLLPYMEIVCISTNSLVCIVVFEKQVKKIQYDEGVRKDPLRRQILTLHDTREATWKVNVVVQTSYMYVIYTVWVHFRDPGTPHPHLRPAALPCFFSINFVWKIDTGVLFMLQWFIMLPHCLYYLSPAWIWLEQQVVAA